MRPRSLGLWLIWLLAALAGCATPSGSPFSNPAFGDPVCIREPVEVVMPPWYHGSEQTALALFGAFTGLAAGSTALGAGTAGAGSAATSATTSEPERIAAYAKDNNIDIGNMVKAEFAQQLGFRPKLAGRLKADAPTKLVLSARYGITNLSFSDYRPFLALTVSVVDSSGKETWKYRDYVGNKSEVTPSLAYEEYFRSPETFRSAFSIAAREAVRSVLDKLDPGGPPVLPRTLTGSEGTAHLVRLEEMRFNPQSSLPFTISLAADGKAKRVCRACPDSAGVGSATWRPEDGILCFQWQEISYPDSGCFRIVQIEANVFEMRDTKGETSIRYMPATKAVQDERYRSRKTR